MKLTTNFQVRVQIWAEATVWVTAETPEEAQLIAEARFKRSGRSDFKVSEEDIVSSEIADQVQFAGTA